MKIEVIKAIGRGHTDIGAFDNALWNAGVANFNLIRLSSVIPEQCKEVVVSERYQRKKAHGDKLYCIYASSVGSQCAAGIAYDRDDETGLGVFVEHEGDNEKIVRERLNKSLDDLFENRSWKLNPGNRHEFSIKAEAENEGEVVCAFVVAVVQEQGWDEE